MNEKTNKFLKFGSAVLFATCFFAYMTSYIGRYTFSALLTSMVGDGVLDKAVSGTIVTAYMLCYGIGQLLFGRLSSSISPQLLMSLGLIGSGLANIGMALIPSYITCLVLWGFCGIFNSMLWPSLTRAFAEWLPEEEKLNAGVNISLSIPLGSVISFLACSLLLKVVDWKGCYLICGGMVVISGVISLAGFTSIRSYISARRAVFKAKLENAVPSGKSRFPAKTLFGSLAVMIIPAVMINGALKDALTSWLPTIVSDIFATDASFSSMISLILPIVSVSGAYVARFIDKHLKNEMHTTAVLFAMAAVPHIILSFLGSENVWITVLLLALSVAATWGINTMTVILFPLRFANIGCSGFVSGLLNSMCCLFSGFASTIYGFWSLKYGWMSMFVVWSILGVMAALFALISSKSAKNIKF